EFSAAFKRPVWGDKMRGYESIRNLLSADPLAFTHLDAAQLVKHALGLRTVVTRETHPPAENAQLWCTSTPSRPPGRTIGRYRPNLTRGTAGRLRSHNKHKRNWAHFSVFEVHDNVTREEIRELESLLLGIFRDDHRIRLLNMQLGSAALKQIR